MRFTLSFHAQGDRYLPSKVAFTFHSQHDFGDIGVRGRFKGKPYPYGASEIRVADTLPRHEKVSELVVTVASVLPQMKSLGADSFHIWAGYFYEAQCNLEFAPRELELLASLDCPFCLSCYVIDAEVPNQTSDPTLASVTPPAEQESRLP